MFKVFAGLLSITLFLSLSGPSYSKDYGIVEWQNSSPEFSSIGLPTAELENLIGEEGQLVIVKTPTESKIWSKGEVKSFKGVRYSIAATIVDSSIEAVKSRLLDIESLHSFMPQVEKEKLLEVSSNHKLVEFDQVYNLPGPLNLRAKFRIQITEEEDGDISWLLQQGDVDTGVSRWEFIKISENKTLVSLTNWQDLDSAGLAFRALLEAQPELKPVIPVIATNMYLQQLKLSFMKSAESSKKSYQDEIRIPYISNSGISLDLVEKLIEQGTVIIVHPKQLIDYRGKSYSMLFTTAMNIMDGPIGRVKPISSDYRRMGEYFPWAYQVDTKTIPGGEEVELFLKIKLPVISMKLRNKLQSKWVDENTLSVEAISGAMNPMFGSWEYLSFQGDKTIMAFTSASKVGDEANWMLKMIRNIPLTDLVMSTYMGMMIIEKQKPWVESELEGQR